jgi:hypothetical protein
MPSVNFNFIALLLGLAAVVALYFSALSADQEIAKTKEREQPNSKRKPLRYENNLVRVL